MIDTTCPNCGGRSKLTDAYKLLMRCLICRHEWRYEDE